MTKKLFLLTTVLAVAGGLAHAQQVLRFEDVVRNLRHRDASVRLDALQLLHGTGYPEAIAAIAPLVMDPSDRVQRVAIMAEVALFMVEPLTGRRKVAGFIELRDTANAEEAFSRGALAVQPRQVPPELVRNLVAATKETDQRVALDAIYALGIVARAPTPPEVDDRLTALLDSREAELRYAAARAIGRIGIPSAGARLVTRLNDPDRAVRVAAGAALGEIREPSAVQGLTQLFEYHKKGLDAEAMLAALAKIGDPASVPLLRAQLASPSDSFRRYAVDGLGRAGDRESIAAIEPLFTSDKAPEVRLAAAFALQLLGRDALHDIVNGLSQERVMAQAQGYLVEMGPAIADSLVPYLQAPDPIGRALIADILGAIGSPKVLPALDALRTDGDPAVGAAAERAMERIRLTGSTIS